MREKSKRSKGVLALIVVVLVVGVIAGNQLWADSKDNNQLQEVTPPVIQACKEYLDKGDFIQKDAIDYSIYHITKLTYARFLEANFSTDNVISEETISNYVEIVIGDTQVGKNGEHNYAVLLVEDSSQTVCGYAPIK